MDRFHKGWREEIGFRAEYSMFINQLFVMLITFLGMSNGRSEVIAIAKHRTDLNIAETQPFHYAPFPAMLRTT